MRPTAAGFAAGCAALVLSSAASAAAFVLSSPELKPNATIAEKHVYNGFGCSGDNLSPALAWKNPPKGTKSFALMVHDPDAPTGGAGWWHWVVYNLPENTSELPENTGAVDGKNLPKGAAQQATDFGVPGWGGPCPPAGDKPHRYVFTVYALKVDKLDVPVGATASLVGFLVNANSLGKASFTARYGRPK